MSSGPGLEHAGGQYRLLAARWGKFNAGAIVDLDDEQARRLVQPGVFELASEPEQELPDGLVTDVAGVPNFPLVASSDPGPAVQESAQLQAPSRVVRRARRRR